MADTTPADDKAAGKSPAMPLLGSDGHLFLSNDNNRLFDQHVGLLRMALRDITKLADIHVARNDVVVSGGGVYIHIVVPNKETVLNHLLPEDLGYQRHGMTPVNRYLHVREDVRPFTVFAPDVLRNLPADAVFRRDDTHWTALGAYFYMGYIFASRPMLQSSAHYFFGPMDVVMNTQAGDLGSKIPGFPPSHYPSLTPRLPEAEIVYSNGLANRARTRIFHNRHAPCPSVVFVAHDSFGDRLYAILPFIFSDVVFMHTADFDAELVRNLRPDIYLDMQIERFFPRLPFNMSPIAAKVSAIAATRNIAFSRVDFDAAFDVLAARQAARRQEAFSDG